MAETGIEIAAAGKSTRLREHITELGYPNGYPKLLLPTGRSDGETLLGRVTRQALEAPVPGFVTIHTSEENERYLRQNPDISPLIDGAEVRLARVEYGNSFRPFLPKLVKEGVRVLGSSGDFYAEFSWADVLDTHESNNYPVTFVVGQTVAVDNGAVFDVSDNGLITDFARVDRTKQSDLVNVGIYVFDPTDTVLSTLSSIVSSRYLASEEDIVTTLIAKGLMGAHVLERTPYNVNSAETYQALLAHAQTEQVVA